MGRINWLTDLTHDRDGNALQPSETLPGRYIYATAYYFNPVSEAITYAQWSTVEVVLAGDEGRDYSAIPQHRA